MYALADSKWLRVNKRNPCLVCGKPDWCLISPDGETAICARTESDKPAGNKGAGWIHRIGGNHSHIPLPAPKQVQAVKQLPIASIDRRNTVYQALLTQLHLSDNHKNNLLSRGLTQEEIDHRQYRSMSTDRGRVVHELSKSGMKIGGVPGFYMRDGDIKLSGAPGILIPVRDIKGRIQAFQIRCDHVEGGKYLWLSSADKHYGCSSGCPVHVVMPEGADTGEVWITEGPLKADIAGLNLKRVILAVAGVGNWHGIIPIIRELKAKRAVIAFDMDKISNSAVKLPSEVLTACLIKHGIRTFEADWDSRFKGLDDLLTGDQ